MPGFTKRYGVSLLVWFEIYDDPTSAITREKEIKKWRRDWKVALIEETNPTVIFIPRSPNSAAEYGFRVRAFGAPRNDG